MFLPVFMLKNGLKTVIWLDLAQLYAKKCNFFETFFSKHLQVTDFCYTFASAFENERNLKQNELSSC